MPSGNSTLYSKVQLAKIALLVFVLNICNHSISHGNQEKILASKVSNEKNQIFELSQLFKESLSASQIVGTFNQVKELKELDITLKSTGTFLIKKLDKQKGILQWNVVTPEKSDFCLDDQVILIKNDKVQKIKLAELSEGTYDQILQLKNIMGLDLQFLTDNFQTEIQKNKASFVPKNSKFPFTKIEIETQKGLIQSISMIDKNKDSLKISFQNVKLNQKSDLSRCE